MFQRIGIVDRKREEARFQHGKRLLRLLKGHLVDEIDESGVAQALRAGDGGSSRSKKIVTTLSVRRLTPLECERLQGFPDHWTDIPGNSDTQRYRQLGNTVAVPVVEWLMKRIGSVVEGEPS